MGALTPVRPALPSGLVTGSFSGQVSLIHVPGLPTLPPPTTPVAPTPLSHATPQLAGLPPVPRRSGLRHQSAGSPVTIGRIEFVILRTGRSPPVASHHASRRDLALPRDRSYVRLQAGERLPGEDFHPSDQARFQAHRFFASLRMTSAKAFSAVRLQIRVTE